MPEGHTLHRAADEITERLGGQVVRTSSPQGRFAEGAGLVDGHRLTRSHAHGKHLFVEFDDGHTVHVHLGLYGTLTWSPSPGADPLGALRLRITGKRWTLDLRAATVCELLETERLAPVTDRLGADPLRADADPDAAGARIRGSRAPIATLLMDQTIVSGVGNVYRAEMLFRHRLHPYAPGTAISRPTWKAMWADLVELMRAGVRTGRIDTVRPEHEPETMGREPRVDDHGGEVYVYRRAGRPCHVCGTRVRTEVLGGRNLFWCSRCQRRGRPRRDKPHIA